MRVGLVLPIADEDGADGVAPSYAEIRDLALAAEAGGLDSVWVFDHLLFRFDGEDDRHPRVLDDPVRHRRGDVAGWSSARSSCARASATRRCWPRWPRRSTTSAAGG